MGVLSCPVTVGDANDGHLYGYLEFEGGPQYPSILFYLLGMFHFYRVFFFLIEKKIKGRNKLKGTKGKW